MNAFEKLEWGRFDVWAIAALEGVIVVETAQREACIQWLRQRDYKVNSIDFEQGVGPAVGLWSEQLNWEAQFSYRLSATRRNLNAVRDGFDFGLKSGEGGVLEMLHAEVAFKEDADWLMGLLGIAREHSRQQLALGIRFFAILFLDQGSELIGLAYERICVPGTYRGSGRNMDPFA